MMDVKINYDKLLQNELAEIEKSGSKPSLLLHACCAPCSTYVLEYLSNHFDITVYFYNPNIYPKDEYYFRADELSRFIADCYKNENIKVVCENYNDDEFYEAISGLEGEGEGSTRCKRCYELRLDRAGRYAAENRFDYFTTTLSISPYKNCKWLNEIGGKCAEKYNIKYLFSDFKKNNGYKRSCEMSREYGLYRQDYCGCIYSKQESERRNRGAEKLN